MKNYNKIIAAVVAGMACAAATTSQASLSVVGSLLNQDLYQTSPTPTSPYGAGTVEGTVSSWVLKDSVTGYLTFVYQINTTGAPDTIYTTAFNGFSSSIVTSEGAGTDGESSLALFGLNFGSSAGLGDFSFSHISGGGGVTFTSAGLPAGDTSDFFYVATDITTFGDANANEIDDFTATGVTLAPVPEPTTVVAGALMLLPLGIGAVRSLRKDRTV